MNVIDVSFISINRTKLLLKAMNLICLIHHPMEKKVAPDKRDSVDSVSPRNHLSDQQRNMLSAFQISKAGMIPQFVIPKSNFP